MKNMTKAACLLFILTCLLLLVLPQNGEGADTQTWSEVEGEMRELADGYPNLTALHALDSTWQGRTVWGLRIFDEGYLNESIANLSELTVSPDPAMLFLAAHHGDEKQGVNLTLTLARELLEGYGTDENLTAMLKARDLWFIPVANPDGYALDTRKNGRDNDEDDEFDPDMDGVDLNRNFAHQWGVDEHTSSNPASEFYHGPEPFSEPETMALRDLANAINFSATLSYHSGTSRPAIYYPWGWNESLQLPDDELANFTSISSNLSLLTGYDHGQATDPGLGGYEARGDLADWLFANHSTLAYTVELPRLMTAEQTEANLEAVWWLLAQPWGNETEGPLDNRTEPEPEPEPLPDVWLNGVSSRMISLYRNHDNDSLYYSIFFTIGKANLTNWSDDLWKMRIEVDNTTYETKGINWSLVNASGWYRLSWYFPAEGQYEICGIVDPNDEHSEANESNNVACTVIIAPKDAWQEDGGFLAGPGWVTTLLGCIALAGIFGRHRQRLP